MAFLIGSLYYTILTGSSLQGTLGKAAVRLKVCVFEGKSIDHGRAFARRFCGQVLLWLFLLVAVAVAVGGVAATRDGAILLGILVFFVAIAVVYIPVIFSSRRQTLYDMMVWTIVVERD
jgi:uncharacterized RDD family membrane protein YckC